MAASDDSNWADAQTKIPVSSDGDPDRPSLGGLFALPDWNDSILDAVVHASSKLEPRVAKPREPRSSNAFLVAMATAPAAAPVAPPAIVGQSVGTNAEAEAFFAAARQASIAAEGRRVSGSHPTIDLDSGLLNLESGNFDLSNSGFDLSWAGGSNFGSGGFESGGERTSGLLSVGELRDIPNQLTDILEAIERDGAIGARRPPEVPAPQSSKSRVDAFELDGNAAPTESVARRPNAKPPSPLPPSPRAGDRRPRRARFESPPAKTPDPDELHSDAPQEVEPELVDGGRYATRATRRTQAGTAVVVKRPDE